VLNIIKFFTMEETKQKEMLIGWLKDAYAMERSLEKTVAAYVKDSKEKFPMVAEKLTEHLDETKAQAERIKARLEELDEDVSSLKDIIGQVVGEIQGHAPKIVSDTPIKNAWHAFASEHFEIACYSTIMAAAEKLGDDKTAELARQSMEEEQAMADWAQENLPSLVEDFLDREEE